MAQPPPPQFDVVVIRPASPDDKNWRMEFNPGLMRIENRSLRDTIQFACDLKTDAQMLGAPSRAATQHFDIEGKEDPELAKQLEIVPLDAGQQRCGRQPGGCGRYAVSGEGSTRAAWA